MIKYLAVLLTILLNTVMNFPFSFWKNVDNVPGVSYKIFSGTTTSTNAVCTNGVAEVEYSYASVSAGNGSALFLSTFDGCPSGVSLTITACLPADAIVIAPPINAGDPISGTDPRITPTVTGTDC